MKPNRRRLGFIDEGAAVAMNAHQDVADLEADTNSSMRLRTATMFGLVTGAA